MTPFLRTTALVTILAVAACGQAGTDGQTQHGQTQEDQIQNDAIQAGQTAGVPELGDFGVDLTARNVTLDPGDDFFAYANGTWLDAFEIPEDKSRYGAFTILRDRSEERTRAIIDDLAGADAPAGSPEQLVGDYYGSFLDINTVNAKGMAPIRPLLEAISAIDGQSDLAAAFGRAERAGGAAPIRGGLSINRLNPDEYQYSIGHSGLGLPDRDYYLEETDRFTGIREKYQAHIAEMLTFAGMDGTDGLAADIVALETRIAGAHWPRADRRNRDKTLNPTKVSELSTHHPNFDWQAFFTGAGADVAVINLSHPSAMDPIIAIINETPLETWKAYLTFHTLANHAFLLSEDVDTARFNFSGKVLRGQPEQRERWKRGVQLVSGLDSLGEALGQIYVQRHFPESAKRQMEGLVENLRTALGLRIDQLDWMGEDTKALAREKLAAFRPKIAYPDTWRTYDGLNIEAGDLFGNYVRVRDFFYDFDMARLNRPTDRDEWFMTPQTVNAYYNPPYNEIVFPAAILQPPFFDPYADPAVNYGAIGAVIGHEMGHGFDDQGSKSDARGVQRNWWTEEDRARFEERADALVAQYNAYEPIEGATVDGRFTLGENIGDLGGLSMAYHAYKLSLGGKEAPVIDGLTGDQRFFLAWAQVWRSKDREQTLLARLKSDPHSPEEFRVNGVVRNMDAWYDAFGVTSDNALYLPPEQRVSIW